jgi:hypothetical protein
MSDLEKVNKLIQANTNSQFKEFIDEHHSGIVEGNTRNKIPEQVFKQNFLPYFSGNVESARGRNIMAEWIGVAGTAMSEVDVVGNNNEILFTVPALFDTNVIDITKRALGQGMGDIIEDYNLRKESTPIGAMNMLNNNLGHKLSEIIHDDVPQRMTTAERWINIMGRYGIAPPSDRLSAQATKPAVDDNTDDVVYD